MLTTGEQQELRQIEQELKDTDRKFARELTLRQGMLRWAAPGRHVYLPALAALAAVLLRLVAAAGRLLAELARAAAVTEQATVMTLGDSAWLGWESRQVPGHGASPAPGRPQRGGRGRR